MQIGKKIKDMTPEERNEYNRRKYNERVKGSTIKELRLTIMNCTPELEEAILAAIRESK